MTLSRRTLLKTSITSMILTAFSTSAVQAKTQPHSRATKHLKAKRLQAGNTIGLISPASNVWENEEISFAIDVLKSFGFKVKKGKYLYQRYGYLAGNEKERAWDVNNMFADPNVDAIFCLRGGYGSPQVLPYLDYELIKRHPKALIGYSDITALLNAITAKTGLITFHGPIAKQNFTDYTLANFKKVLFNPKAPISLASPPAFEPKEGQAEQDNRLSVIHQGSAQGELIGGNLSLMVKLIGTPYEPDYRNKILFLEDIEEAPYRIDGMLTHLSLAGRLQQVAGIIFGKCTDCEAESAPSLSIEQVLFDRFAQLNIPIIRGLMIGHIDDLATIPIGAKAKLTTTPPALTLQETAVI